ncbi:MAG TPA: nitroreductase family protein [Candidatus Limnocylindrales bacterium]|nr:nitroreductase family protein [Candidatus Limnocylindrales bacterium]
MSVEKEAVRPLLRTRQFREFTAEPPSEAQLDAIVDAARWTGSAGNEQPWRLIVIRNVETLRHLAEAGMPQTRGLRTATAAIAIALPEDEYGLAKAYDDGRVAERILVAAQLVGLGAGIGWVRKPSLPSFAEALALPEGWFIRTIMSVGHPSAAALAPKSKPGEARKPRAEVVFEEHWPAS